MMPPLHPRYYGDDGLSGGELEPFPVPSLEELDRLFLSEQEQKRRMEGYRAWQFGPLNNTLYGDFSGGHQRPASAQDEQNNASAFDQGRLVIDESKWLPWLRRENWWVHQIPDNRRAPGRKLFTVDDDEVWKELRVPLELANRILNLLIDSRHPL